MTGKNTFSFIYADSRKQCVKSMKILFYFESKKKQINADWLLNDIKLKVHLVMHDVLEHCWTTTKDRKFKRRQHAIKKLRQKRLSLYLSLIYIITFLLKQWMLIMNIFVTSLNFSLGLIECKRHDENSWLILSAYTCIYRFSKEK